MHLYKLDAPLYASLPGVVSLVGCSGSSSRLKSTSVLSSASAASASVEGAPLDDTSTSMELVTVPASGLRVQLLLSITNRLPPVQAIPPPLRPVVSWGWGSWGGEVVLKLGGVPP